MAEITVSKEKECKLLWSFIAPMSENVATLAAVLAETHKVFEEHIHTLTRVDGEEHDWKEVSKRLLSTADGFMDFVKRYCLAYTDMLRELKESLTIVEETDEEVEE